MQALSQGLKPLDARVDCIRHHALLDVRTAVQNGLLLHFHVPAQAPAGILLQADNKDLACFPVLDTDLQSVVLDYKQTIEDTGCTEK